MVLVPEAGKRKRNLRVSWKQTHTQTKKNSVINEKQGRVSEGARQKEREEPNNKPVSLIVAAAAAAAHAGRPQLQMTYLLIEAS